MGTRSRFVRALAIAAAGLLFGVPTASAPADSEHDGPAFLVVSVSDTFSLPDVSAHCHSSSDGGCHDNRCGCKKRKRNDKKNCTCTLPSGSALVVVPVGTFIAGYDVRNTYFVSGGTTASDALADEIAELGGIEYLDGNQVTVFGAVDTTGPNTIHLLTPDPGAVLPEVQEAVFFASPVLLALSPDDPAYPKTTVQLAEFVWLNQAPPDFSPDLPPAKLQQILDYLFLSQATLDCTTCETEGELFPHDPDPEEPLLTFALSFDSDGNVAVEGCTLVAVDVRPGYLSDPDPVDLSGDGVIPVAILSSRGQRPDENGNLETYTFFDPADVDPDTVRFGAAKELGVEGQDWVGATPVGYIFEDENGDGVDDLIVRFAAQDLADAGLGGMTADTTAVELRGQTSTQGCIQGTDSVVVTQ